MSYQYRHNHASMIFVLTGDVLRIIIDFLLAPRDDLARHEVFEQVKQTQDARLVCRCFNELASPYLLPNLDLTLSQESLDRAKAILSNPNVVAGIRGLRISLPYSPKQLADNIESFIFFQLFSLNEVHEALQETSSRRVPVPLDLIKSLEVSAMVLSSGGDQLPIAAFPFEGVAQGHEILRAMYTEQRAMEQAGSFIQQLKAIVSHIPRIRSLEIMKEDRQRALTLAAAFMREEYENTKLHQNETLLKAVCAFLWRPLNWDEVAHWNKLHSEIGSSLMSPARILLDIPNALCEVGLRVRRFSLPCFPIPIALFQGPMANAAPTDLNGLYLASQDIEDCIIGSTRTYKNDRLQRKIDDDQQAYINRYIRAITSSTRLKSLFVDLNTAIHVGQSRYRIGSALRGLNNCSLASLTMKGLLFSEATLKTLCIKLGNELEVFHLSNIELGGDSGWFEVLDILRGKLSRRAKLGKVIVSMDELAGGGINIDSNYDTDDTVTDTEVPNSESIFKQCEDYVCGKGDGRNPLAPADELENE